MKGVPARHLSLRAALRLLPALPLLAGCAALGSGGGSSSRPEVVAAFYPYAYVAGRVAGGHAAVTNLTTAGLEPHDLELTPHQVATISEADLVVYEAGFQPSIDEAVDQGSGVRLDVTDVVPLRDTGTQNAGTQVDADPHLWLDPTLLVPVVATVRDDLAKVDPDHANAYRSNAHALVADLTRLDSDFAAGLANCRRTEFVTSHAAFGYLADRYGLAMVPIAGLSPDAEPSPEHLAQIQDSIEADGITTVFSETLGSKKYADTLAADLQVTTAVLDPIEGLADETSGDDYLSLMRANLAALKEANDCR